MEEELLLKYQEHLAGEIAGVVKLNESTRVLQV